jgi:hypothetical protein
MQVAVAVEHIQYQVAQAAQVAEVTAVHPDLFLELRELQI